MQICDPSDKEKGHYSIEVSDGVTTHTRTFDLSGQGKPTRVTTPVSVSTPPTNASRLRVCSVHRRLRGVPETQVSHVTAVVHSRSCRVG